MFKKRDKSKSKELIIKAAITIFAKYGYERATYKMISEVAGLNESLITRYFGGKEGLLITAMDFIRKEFQAISDKIEHKQSFLEEIHFIGNILVEMYEQNRNNFLTFFMLLPNEIGENVEVVENVEVEECVLSSKNKIEFIFKFDNSRFKKFQDKGEIPKDMDIEELYTRLITLLHSTLYFSFIVLKQPMQEAKELLHFNIDTFIKGITSTKS